MRQTLTCLLNPKQAETSKRPKAFLTKNARPRIYTTAPHPTYRSYRDLALIELLRATGIRISEIPTLNINQISIGKGIVAIPIPKTAHPRRVQILYESGRSNLEQYLKLRKAIESGYVNLMTQSAR